MSAPTKKHLTKIQQLKLNLQKKMQQLSTEEQLMELNILIDKIIFSPKGIEIQDAIPNLSNEDYQIGKSLKACRYKMGLTQEEASKLLGIKQSNLSAMENNKRLVGIKLARKLAKIYKTKLDYFLRASEKNL